MVKQFQLYQTTDSNFTKSSNDYQNIHLCHIKNGETKLLNLTVSNQNTFKMLLNRLNKSTGNHDLPVTENSAKFEEFKMNKIQCEFAIDEHFPRKMLMSGNKF